jgi:hypothetical protein
VWLKKQWTVWIAVVFAGGLLQSKVYGAQALSVPLAEDITLSDHTGQMFLHVAAQDALQVNVQKWEPEGIFCYYDAAVSGAEGQTETIWQMDLSRCEYLVDTGKYASHYTVSISSAADADAVYTTDLVVEDPDFESTESTVFHFYVTLEQRTESGFQLLSSMEKVEDGVRICTQYLTLQEATLLLGDVDGDGTIAISDASVVLEYYAKTAAGLKAEIDIAAADVDQDGDIALADASYILTYYAREAAGLSPDWDEILS